MHITILASNEIFLPSNKIHREVGRAKDLSAPRYKCSFTSLLRALYFVVTYAIPRGSVQRFEAYNNIVVYRIESYCFTAFLEPMLTMGVSQTVIKIIFVKRDT